ncbi:MAG: hypothetical protein NZ777_10900 [Pseudomonadales bacterium]|nr:hypothetical protein [Pseudomonadales bacterium]
MINKQAMNVVCMTCISLLVVFGLSGCGTAEQELHERSTSAKFKVDLLISNIEQGSRITNVRLLREYADVVKHDSPELTGIAEALAADGTVEGPIVRGLQERLEVANNQIGEAILDDAVVANLLEEFDRIKIASEPERFGMMLTDPINVLADMSNGTLARVESMSKKATQLANQSTDLGAGSQLIGNPNYGQWRQDQYGTSFWGWYGRYAFFSAMFYRPIGYGYWAGQRPYSYYSDYGRSYYNSPATQKRQDARVNKFKGRTRTFQSPYARTRSGGSANVRKKSKAESNLRRTASSRAGSARARSGSRGK